MAVMLVGLVVFSMFMWACYWIARRCGWLSFVIEQVLWLCPSIGGEVWSLRLENERKHAADERRKGAK